MYFANRPSLGLYAARYPLRSIRSLVSLALFLLFLISVLYSLQLLYAPAPPTPEELFGYGVTDDGIIFNKAFKPSSIDLADIAFITDLAKPAAKGKDTNTKDTGKSSDKKPAAAPKPAPKPADPNAKQPTLKTSPALKEIEEKYVDKGLANGDKNGDGQPGFPNLEITQDRGGPNIKAKVKAPSNPQNLTTTLVVGRLDKDVAGVQWIHDYLKDITHKKIYIVDDPKAPLHLDENKGRESAVYLRYIIDNYERLDDVTIFFHSSRMAWHNNVFFQQDGAMMINQLRREHVMKVGYFNLRCELYPGCPKWIKFDPDHDSHWAHPERGADLFIPKLWKEMFPNETAYPDYLAEPCCSQFAASREAIRSFPLAQWKQLYEWILSTKHGSGFSGRIMEYVWQYAFTRAESYCPSMKSCYCEGYGVCVEDDRQLVEYNDLRAMVDDVLTVLAEWNQHYDCHEKQTKAAIEACKKENPYNTVINQVRKKKMDYERDFPKMLDIAKPEVLSH